MQFTVKDVRLESQMEGPDCVKIRLTTPTGATVDLVQDVPRDGGEKWLVEQFGGGQRYQFWSIRKNTEPRQRPIVIDEERST